jgi:hypothetical protein
MSRPMTAPERRRPARAPASITAAEHRAWTAAVAVLDRIAGDLEREWGVDRLPTLVPPDLAAKFATAQEHCDVAIASGDIDAAAQKAAALARGWQALDKAARAAGHTPGSTGDVWCAAVEGRPYAVCLHTVDCAALAAAYPGHTAVSLQELLRLLAATEAGRLVARVKDVFPGATLAAVKPATKPPADWKRGDALPF